MPTKRKSKAPPSQAAKKPDGFNLLIVDDEAEIRDALDEALRREHLTVRQAGTLADAQNLVEREAVDLVVLDVALPDGNSLPWAQQLRDKHPAIQTIVITGHPSMEHAVDAIRAGAVDFMPKPLDLNQLNEQVDRAVLRHEDETKRLAQISRLKLVCKKLNRARHEITQQVDILCNDLVSAYQDLVHHMRHVELTTEFRALVQEELDLERLLRRSLEFILDKVGPTNAVIFLPSETGGYSVGGYINYSFDSSTADVLLDHLSDVAAERIASAEEPIRLNTNAQIEQWLGDDAAWLADADVVGVPCRDDGEDLAALMLFRDNEQPFDDQIADALAALSTVFAEHLVRVIRVHNRHLPFDDDNTDGHEAFL